MIFLWRYSEFFLTSSMKYDGQFGSVLSRIRKYFNYWKKKIISSKYFPNFLTHIRLASHFWDIGKQCRPSSDAADQGFQCLLRGISIRNRIKKKKKNTTPDTPKTGNGLVQLTRMDGSTMQIWVKGAIDVQVYISLRINTDHLLINSDKTIWASSWDYGTFRPLQAHSSNMHTQPPSAARCLIFGRTLRLRPYFMYVNSEGSGKTARMRSLISEP